MSLTVYIECDECDKKVELHYDEIRKNGLIKFPEIEDWIFEAIYNENKDVLHFCSKECREKRIERIKRICRFSMRI